MIPTRPAVALALALLTGLPSLVAARTASRSARAPKHAATPLVPTPSTPARESPSSIAPTSAAAIEPTPVPRSRRAGEALRSSVRVRVLQEGELLRTATGVAVDIPRATSTPLTAGEGSERSAVRRIWIVTNAHVVETSGTDAPPLDIEVDVEKQGRAVEQHKARLIAAGEPATTDLAVLELEVPTDTAIRPARLARPDDLEAGAEVVVIGTPYGRGLSVSGGMVSRVEYDQDPDRTGLHQARSFKTDAPIGYGSSGGGVFLTATGGLAGVVEGYRTARVAIDEHRAFDIPMPGETFASAIPQLERFLEQTARHAEGMPGAQQSRPENSDGSPRSMDHRSPPSPLGRGD